MQQFMQPVRINFCVPQASRTATALRRSTKSQGSSRKSPVSRHTRSEANIVAGLTTTLAQQSMIRPVRGRRHLQVLGRHRGKASACAKAVVRLFSISSLPLLRAQVLPSPYSSQPLAGRAPSFQGEGPEHGAAVQAAQTRYLAEPTGISVHLLRLDECNFTSVGR